MADQLASPSTINRILVFANNVCAAQRMYNPAEINSLTVKFLANRSCFDDGLLGTST